MKIDRGIEQKMFVIKELIDDKINNKDTMVTDIDILNKFAEFYSSLFLTCEESDILHTFIRYYDCQIIDKGKSNPFKRDYEYDE